MFVADGSAGLVVVDVSDKENPSLIDDYDTPGDADGVHVIGNIAYVADWDGGLRILDVSDITDVGVTVDSPNGGEDYDSGDTVTIEWTATGPVDHFDIAYSLDNGGSWTPIATVDGDDAEYDWEIPEIYSLYALIRITATGVSETVDSDRSDDFFVIEQVTSSFTYEGGWNLITLPLTPDDNDPEAVIGDDLPGEWVLYGFNNEQGFFVPETLESGPAYWFAISHDDEVTVDMSGSASLDTVRFNLELGWNMIGDPFPGNIDLDDIYFDYEDQRFSKDDAVSERFIVPILYRNLSAEGGYNEMEDVEPWRGAWFLALQDGLEMVIHPPEPAEPAGPDPGSNPPQLDDADEGSQRNWKLQIGAAFGDAIDNITTIGAHYNATDGFDLGYDFPEPPNGPANEYVKAYFQHDDWERIVGNLFNRDIRDPLDDETAEWRLTVENSEPGTVTLSWEDIEDSVPQGYGFSLEDPTAGREIDMIDVGQYDFEGDGESREFIVTVMATPLGVNDSKVIQPKRFALLGAYPNPFNSMTTIRYDIPQRAFVSVRVLNLSGREVADLASVQTGAGRHNLVWNAQSAPAGVYFVHLEAGSIQSLKKVVLVK